jgi:hypothetical protein
MYFELMRHAATQNSQPNGLSVRNFLIRTVEA